MVLNIRNPVADRLARDLAEARNVPITEAVIDALREAVARLPQRETPLEAARRLRAQHGVALTEHARQPVPASAWAELHEGTSPPSSRHGA